MKYMETTPMTSENNISKFERESKFLVLFSEEEDDIVVESSENAFDCLLMYVINKVENGVLRDLKFIPPKEELSSGYYIWEGITRLVKNPEKGVVSVNFVGEWRIPTEAEMKKIENNKKIFG